MNKLCLVFIFLLTFVSLANIIESKTYGQTYFEEDWYERYINEGINYLEQNRFNDAERQFLEAQRIVPDAPDAYINLAIINIFRNDIEGAIYFLEKAKDLMPYGYPQEHVVFYNLGVCFYEKGDYKTAAQYYSKALSINPGFEDAKRGLNLSSAQIKITEGKSFDITVPQEQTASPYESYADIWEIPVPLNDVESLSDEEKLQIELMYRNLKEGRRPPPPRIIPDVEETAKSVPPIEVEKSVPPAEVGKSVPPVEVGKSVSPVEVEKGEQDSIVLAKEYLKEGSLIYESGNTKGAIEKIKESIRLDPKNAQAHYRLGLIYAEKNAMEKAIDAFNNAIKYDPDLTKAYLNLGGAYGVLRQYDQALTALEHALRLDRNNPKIYFNMAMVYTSKGEKTQAKKYFAEAKKLALQEKDSVLLEKIKKYYQ
jgi:tetratricopeptide (TPR) repeat protein